MLDKASQLAADSLILDLEDAVSPADKELARANVKYCLQNREFGEREVLVRINSLDSAWGLKDLEALAQILPDGIVIPKARNRKDIESIDELLNDMEAGNSLESGTVPLLVIATESAAAVLNMSQIASHPRVNAIAWGAEDLAVSLGSRARRDEQGNYLEVFTMVRSLSLLAAVAQGIQPVDAPFMGIEDKNGFEKECQRAADMGFTGKLTIHPSQIDVVNRIFSPTAEEIDAARALIAEFEKQQQRGVMAFVFAGQMVDTPHLLRARALLSRARLLELL